MYVWDIGVAVTRVLKPDKHYNGANHHSQWYLKGNLRAIYTPPMHTLITPCLPLYCAAPLRP